MCSSDLSDRDALLFAWATFGKSPKIVEKTHLYPEWKRHEAAIVGGTTRVPMSYYDFLEDPPTGVNPCHNLSDEERQARREQLREMEDVAALWS